ncbi:MAG: ABC transporter ATP-binding protein [SAR324 cluster bacterium]|nr:ABC transporter ATP-binding protein [SAR324 cluster bacterium]
MSAPLMSVRALTVNFSGLRALDRVSFSVNPGKITGIIGPNGAGKTTLFNVIAGHYRPSGGQIIFGERNITGWKSDRVCRLGISRTYQHVRPFLGLSVYNNVKVGFLYGHQAVNWKQKELSQEIASMLEFVGLEGLGEKRAEELIPLNRKRLEVARALATHPRLLLLDELIAGLTPTETLSMMETIRQINAKGITVLMIEHVMKAVMGLSDKVVVLHHGEVIAEGSPAQVAGDQAVIDAYLGAQH